MARSLACWVALWLCACGGGSVGDDVRDGSFHLPWRTDTSGSGDTRVSDTAEAVSAEATEDDVTPLPCAERHVLDGAFTNRDGQLGAGAEWGAADRLVDPDATLYVEACGPTLHALIDAHRVTAAPLPAACHASLVVNVNGDVLHVRVFGDGHAAALLDGQPYDAGVQGATGFGPSPANEHADHALVELAVDLPGQGEVSLVALYPVDGTACDDDATLTPSAAVAQGTFDAAGLLLEAVPGLPFVTALEPWQVPQGGAVVARGLRLGDETGAVYLDDVEVAVTDWASDRAGFVADAEPGWHRARVFAGKREAPGVRLAVACAPDCGARDCGDDGCGGSCGECPADQVCQQGACVCAPQCLGRECGPDGCGGSCGACGADEACDDDGQCACVPDCTGLLCGPDHCGTTSCGDCPAGQACQDGACVCAPQCAGRQCGPDACGGLCGTCEANEVCTNGVCVCVPDCEGKQCGSDGCGSTCGTCDAGQYCLQWRCECEPQCQGRQCGSDACGGSCGFCPVGQPCVDGHCVCTPACAGRECGPDGCSGTCGLCADGHACVEGQCTCQPSCLNRDCGDDGCGGTCGTCQPSEVCVGHTCQNP